MMKKILIIEYRSETRNRFIEFLEAENFYTISCENNIIGIQKAREELPNLIICNITMPSIDGYEVLTRLHQDIVTATIPVIIITADGTRTDYRKAMELGADDYLNKPFTFDELFRAITACLNKQAILQQRYGATQSKHIPESQDADNATISVAPNSILPSVPKLTKVFDFIEANYHDHITVSDVAQAVGYSPTYLTSLVRYETGKTLHCWIVERRMAQARFLLLNTDQPVNRIAAKVGYPDAGHFIRQFRKLYNTTPKMWKKYASQLVRL